MENLNTNPKVKIKFAYKESKYATGRRKKSIAKVWLKKGSGNIYVNGLTMEQYFKRLINMARLSIYTRYILCSFDVCFRKIADNQSLTF